MRVEEPIGMPCRQGREGAVTSRPLPYPLVVDALDLGGVVRAAHGAPHEGIAPVGAQHDRVRPA